MKEELQPGTLYVVSTPIGNLEDVTLRAVRVLGGVDVVAAEDTRTTRILLDHLGLRTPLVSYHARNEERRSPSLLRRLRAGERIALVTDAGTPGVSDPAFVLIRAALEEGLRVVPVPGPSAVLAALVAGGVPFDRFVFEGFLPVKKGRSSKLARLRSERRTVVLFESPHRILRTLQDLLREVGDRPAAVARELTKKFEEVERGLLSEVLERVRRREPRGEYVIILGGGGRGPLPDGNPGEDPP
ncbi:MAG: 16S rRNA (cytidine(1402)-2'-O)-methyltransferase [Bacteroidota bacterium]